MTRLKEEMRQKAVLVRQRAARVKQFDALFAGVLFYFATPGLCSDLFSFFDLE